MQPLRRGLHQYRHIMITSQLSVVPVVRYSRWNLSQLHSPHDLCTCCHEPSTGTPLSFCYECNEDWFVNSRWVAGIWTEMKTKLSVLIWSMTSNVVQPFTLRNHNWLLGLWIRLNIKFWLIWNSQINFIQYGSRTSSDILKVQKS